MEKGILNGKDVLENYFYLILTLIYQHYTILGGGKQPKKNKPRTMSHSGQMWNELNTNLIFYSSKGNPFTRTSAFYMQCV